jgi:amino acid transporter
MAHEPPLELPPGITIGAGIYVLIGAVAGHAGRYAPWSFLLAGLAMALTVGSYAELSTRFPVSAGEAAYVRATFQSRFLSTLTGLITILIGVISSATASIAAANYIRSSSFGRAASSLCWCWLRLVLSPAGEFLNRFCSPACSR